MPKLLSKQGMRWRVITGIIIGIVVLGVIIGLVIYLTRTKSKKTGSDTTKPETGTTPRKNAIPFETSKPLSPLEPQLPPQQGRCALYDPPAPTPPPDAVEVLPGYVDEPYLDDIADITDKINSLRDQHNACYLTYNEDIARGAQRYASTLAIQDSTNLPHSKDSTYGENLYVGMHDEDPLAMVKRAIDLWYCEELNYDYQNPPRSPYDPSFEKVGHFTNLVWAPSQYYGIGIAKNTKSGNTYIVLRTYLPGNNFTQHFTDNVLPPQQADFPIKNMRCDKKQISNF